MWLEEKKPAKLEITHFSLWYLKMDKIWRLMSHFFVKPPFFKTDKSCGEKKDYPSPWHSWRRVDKKSIIKKKKKVVWHHISHRCSWLEGRKKTKQKAPGLCWNSYYFKATIWRQKLTLWPGLMSRHVATLTVASHVDEQPETRWWTALDRKSAGTPLPPSWELHRLACSLSHNQSQCPGEFSVLRPPPKNKKNKTWLAWYSKYLRSFLSPVSVLMGPLKGVGGFFFGRGFQAAFHRHQSSSFFLRTFSWSRPRRLRMKPMKPASWKEEEVTL